MAQAAGEAGTLLLLDFSFLGLCDHVGGVAMGTSLDGKSLIRLSTSTKLFALAGLRGPGWLVGPGELMREFEGHLPPWRLGEPSIAALRAALSDHRYLKRTRRLLPLWRAKLAEGLGRLPVQVFPSSVNFLLMRLRDGEMAERLVHHLGRRGILVRWCLDFPGLGPEFIRVAVAMPPEMRRLLREMEAFFLCEGNEGRGEGRWQDSSPRWVRRMRRASGGVAS